MSIACAIAGISRLRHHRCFVAKLRKKCGKRASEFHGCIVSYLLVKYRRIKYL